MSRAFEREDSGEDRSDSSGNPGWLGRAVLAGFLYVLAGVVPAELAKSAGSQGMVTFWRLAAWLLSLVVFLFHHRAETSRRKAPVRTSLHVGAGAALGGLLLAAAGPVRSHWGAPDVARVALLSLALWPVITGLAAFLLAFLASKLGLTPPFRKIAIGIVLLTGSVLGVRHVLQLYVVPDQYAPFLQPTREFLNAAIALDSLRLIRLGASPAAHAWGLDAARKAPELLRLLAERLHLGHGMRNGNHTVVLFGAKGLAPCSTWPLQVFFEGPPGEETIQHVVLECQSYKGPVGFAPNPE